MKNSSEVSPDGVRTQVPGTRRTDGSDADRCTAHHAEHRLGVADRPALPSSARIEALADLFALLANATRLKLLLALHDHANAERPELCVCDLASLAGASESMTSHQLRLLRDAGLVRFRRDGKFARYALRDGPQAHLLGDALEHTARR